MADRVARTVGKGRRRAIGLGTGLAAFIALVVMLVSGAFAASPGSPKPQSTAAAAAGTTSSQSTTHSSSTQTSTQTSAQTSTQKAAPALPPTPHMSAAEINAKVNALISKLTVAEKFGQLEMAGPTTPLSTLENQACDGEVGSVLDLTGVSNINAVQAAALAPGCHPRIPLIFSLDVIHGYKTMFPVPLGEASTWDPKLVRNDESVSASEATADGIKWTFNPMVDISRDPRWGRVVEGAGEDPFLGSAIAARQGEGLPGPQFRRRGQDGGDDQALRRLWRSGGRA